MSNTTAEKSSFFGLPAEIRNYTYDFAIGTPAILVNEPTTSSEWRISGLYAHEVSFKVIPSRWLEHFPPPRRHTRPLKTLTGLPSTSR